MVHVLMVKNHGTTTITTTRHPTVMCCIMLLITQIIITTTTISASLETTTTTNSHAFHRDSISNSNNNNSNHNNNSGIISIPLISHATLRQRRLDEGQHHRVISHSSSMERPTQSKYDLLRELQQLQQQQLRINSDTQTEIQIEQAIQVAGLFQGYGTHYADLWCGTPPQRQTVIVDTGSGVTAFPCNECHNCGVPDYHIDPLFDETKSSSFTKLTCADCLRGTCNNDGCSLGMSYQEGSSWNAFEASDLCYVGGFHDRPTPIKQQDTVINDIDPFHAPNFAFTMKFGCQTHITGLFITQLADGIMGMDVATPAFWWQMFDAGVISSKSFSLCFSRKDEADRTGTESGAMSLGGTDTRLHLSPLVYTSTVESSGFYVVHVRKMYLRAGGGGTSALSNDPAIKILQLDIDEGSLNSGRVIVDSGTTDTYFTKKIGDAFGAAFKQLTGETYGHGVKDFTPDELALQPTILFQLSGDDILNQQVLGNSATGSVVGLAGDLDPDFPLDVILAVPPEHYYEYDPDQGGYISRFYDNEGGGGVIGANSMMGHDVFFDIDNYRIGWAESSCDYTSLVQKYTDGDWEPPKKQDEDDPSRIEPSAADDDDTMGDGPADKNDEPSGTYNEPDNTAFCTGIGCQISILVGVVAAVSLVAYRVVRRSSSGPSYDLAQSELELQTVSDIDDHDEFVNNRMSRRELS